ncbi:CHAT domain-containing protein [Microcoleus sp. FACHB-672]|uniref:CHAT domain-containing protein n=1 Tax=Microcoleus sp. FACHB-672 TaxID=2692825 RepID=UPI0028159EFD|nr:CHAT domain-containing protein [Microcoleus sp. FACHB-672]
MSRLSSLHPQQLPITVPLLFEKRYIYTFSRPEQLDLILVPPQGLPIHKSVSAAKGDILLQKLKTFREEITNPLLRRNQNYKQSAIQLYQWIVAPLEHDLQALEIDTLVFAMDAGLRSLPLAALYDGEQFLVEKYNLGLIPSVNLTHMNYSSLKEAQVLAMGISEFKEFSELPAVPVEIKTVTSLRQGEILLNPDFTFNNLKSRRQAKLYQILHFATHADFQPGEAKNSYIQLWDSQLSFDQLRELKWNDPLVELLVLSACRTALGDEQVELGFAGLAVRTGVKSAIASLWYVSDEGTLGLMSEFYKHLNEFPTKAEALRRAQIAMLKGEVRREQNRLLLNSGEEIALPPQPGNFKEPMFSHPFYWAGFTLVGNPW